MGDAIKSLICNSDSK